MHPLVYRVITTCVPCLNLMLSLKHFLFSRVQEPAPLSFFDGDMGLLYIHKVISEKELMDGESSVGNFI